MTPVKAERCDGQVKRIIRDRGFLFITNPVTKEDVFSHRSGSDPDCWDALEVGEMVTYIEQSSPKGLRALDVQSMAG